MYTQFLHTSIVVYVDSFKFPKLSISFKISRFFSIAVNGLKSSSHFEENQSAGKFYFLLILNVVCRFRCL